MEKLSRRRRNFEKLFIRYLTIPVLAIDYKIPNNYKQPEIEPQYRESCAEFYAIARYLTEATGQLYSIDHIDPLNGRFICGLHTPCNLQIMAADENTQKGAEFYPYRKGRGGKREVFIEAIALGLGLK